MKTILILILTIAGLSLRAQTNIIHSTNPINKQGTNGLIIGGFVYQSQFVFTNNEHRGSGTFTNLAPGGVMTFSCDPTNDTICMFSSFPLEVTRSAAATNSITWTNLPGEQYYLLEGFSNKKLPAKSVVGTTTGLKP